MGKILLQQVICCSSRLFALSSAMMTLLVKRGKMVSVSYDDRIVQRSQREIGCYVHASNHCLRVTIVPQPENLVKIKMKKEKLCFWG